FTSTSMALGTAYYMAPEQQTDAAGVDARADLYSVGVIFYELLTGRLPVGRFKTPSEERPALPRGLDAVVLRALEADPAARPASAAAFLPDLRAVRAGKAPAGGAARPGARPGLLIGAAALGAAVLAVVAFAGYQAVLSRRAASGTGTGTGASLSSHST